MKTMMPAALLVAVILFSVRAVTAQGYKSGARLTADSQISLGVTPCDYWEQNDRRYPDGTRQTEFANGLLVTKRPNAALHIERFPGRYNQPFDWSTSSPIANRWIDRQDGGFLDLGEWDSNAPFFQLLGGGWSPNPQITATVFNGCYYPHPYKKSGRFIFWFSYPNSQEYGTGDLTVTETGQYMIGSYTYGGQRGDWSLQRAAPPPPVRGGGGS